MALPKFPPLRRRRPSATRCNAPRPRVVTVSPEIEGHVQTFVEGLISSDESRRQHVLRHVVGSLNHATRRYVITRLIRRLNTGTAQRQESAAQSLVELGTDAISPLSDCLISPGGTPIRTRAASLLACIGQSAPRQDVGDILIAFQLAAGRTKSAELREAVRQATYRLGDRADGARPQNLEEMLTCLSLARQPSSDPLRAPAATESANG